MSTAKNEALPAKEEVLQNEDSLLRGLIEASNFKNDEAFHKKIEIKRGNRALFSFTVRPLDEEEEIACARKATKQIPHPNGVKYGTIDGRMDTAKFRSLKIYTATIEEDRARIWDNKQFHLQFDVMTGVELIDKVLRSGDKDVVIDIINQISGSGANDAVTTEEIAKN